MAVRPRLSVTVIVADAVPLFVMTDVVGVAPVYVLLSKTVLYAVMVDPKEPTAVIVILALDLFCTMFPKVLWFVVVSATDTLEMDGTTVEGTVNVKFLDTDEPIFVLPE